MIASMASTRGENENETGKTSLSSVEDGGADMAAPFLVFESRLNKIALNA